MNRPRAARSGEPRQLADHVVREPDRKKSALRSDTAPCVSQMPEDEQHSILGSRKVLDCRLEREPLPLRLKPMEDLGEQTGPPCGGVDETLSRARPGAVRSRR